MAASSGEPVSMTELRAMLAELQVARSVDRANFCQLRQDFSEGDKSKLFTVRTSEQDRDKVLQTINDLLGNKLKKTNLASFDIDETESQGRDPGLRRSGNEETCVRLAWHR